MLLENAEGIRFDSGMDKLNTIRAEFIGKLRKTDTVLGKSGKIRDTRLIWEVRCDNFPDREAEIHFQNLPQRLMKTEKWQIYLFRE